MIPERYTPVTYALFRIVFGYVFLLYGLQKTAGWFGGTQIPLTSWPQGPAGVVETVCGLMILLGLFTRVTAFVASGEMAVAYFYAHVPRGSLMPIMNMGEITVALCFGFLYIATRGGGRFSLDALLGSSRKG